LTNEENLINEILYEPSIGKSDHLTLIASLQVYLKTDKGSTNYTPRKNYNLTDYETVNEEIVTHRLSYQELDSVNDSWNQLKSDIMSVVDKHTPLVRKGSKINSKKPWINQETLTLIKEKRKLWDNYRKTGLLADYNTYKHHNNKLTDLVRNNRKRFEENIVNTGNKAFYGYVGGQLSSNVSLPPMIMDSKGNNITDQKVISNIFADEFGKAFTREPDGPLPHVEEIPRLGVSLCDIHFSEEEVKNTILNLNEHTAMGPDNIPAVVLKRCATSLCPLITQLMRDSFDKGCLPEDWKKALITPIYKKGNRVDAGNYRPISLTCILCKCMEKIIVKQLRNFLFCNGIVGPEQHGFVPGRSVVTNLLLCLNHWSSKFDSQIPTDVIYLDFQKAFDTVPIQRLLLKLEHLGVRGKLHKWIEGFLTDRYFQVRVGTDLSNTKPVLSSVPQGSVLGPILFILYIVDLPLALNSPVKLFADDTKLFGDPLREHAQLQEDLDSIFAWTQKWMLKLNIDKCSVLHIGTKNPKVTYSLDGAYLKPVNEQKDLGITISCDLKWEKHLISIVKRANSLTYLIRKSFSHLPHDLLIKIYKTYVRPVLEYGYQIWNPYFEKDISMLERVQRRFTKLGNGLRNLTYEERLSVLGLTTLEERRRRGDLIETFKILNEYYDCSELKLMFCLNQNTNLRGHSLKLDKQSFRQNPWKHFLSNRVVDAWNGLPPELVVAPSVNVFKCGLDKLNN
jgi:hypothetical protein